jgi:hypothetical protein
MLICAVGALQSFDTFALNFRNSRLSSFPVQIVAKAEQA